jgi:hypothetical protein
VNFRDPFGLKAEDVGIGCRNLEDKYLGRGGQHCAIRITTDEGAEYIFELLRSDDVKNISGSPSLSNQGAKYTRWTQVDVPEGMSSSEFDAAVLGKARTIGIARNGLDYHWGGGRNSNRYVYDVITGSGGMIPRAAIDAWRKAPGLCGGIAIFNGAGCK